MARDDGTGGLNTTPPPPAPPPPPNFTVSGAGSGSSGGSQTRSGGSGGTSSGSGLRAASTALSTYFRQLNIPGWKSLASWALGLLRSGRSVQEIIAAVYDRPEVKALGIVGKDGRILMDLGEYSKYASTARGIAAQFGVGLTQAQIATAIQNENSPDELQVKFRAYQVANANQGLIPQINAQIDAVNADLKKRGLPANVPHIRTAQDFLNFTLQQSDVRVYNTYEAAAFQAAAKGAGFDLSIAESQALARSTAGVLDYSDITGRLAEVKKQVEAAGVELESFGVSRSTLLRIQVGSASASDIRNAEQALKQRQAQITTPNIAPQVGLQAGRPVVASQQDIGF